MRRIQCRDLILKEARKRPRSVSLRTEIGSNTRNIYFVELGEIRPYEHLSLRCSVFPTPSLPPPPTPNVARVGTGATISSWTCFIKNKGYLLASGSKPCGGNYTFNAQGHRDILLNVLNLLVNKLFTPSQPLPFYAGVQFSRDTIHALIK